MADSEVLLFEQFCGSPALFVDGSELFVIWPLQPFVQTSHRGSC